MIKATYVGPVEHLKNKSALIARSAGGADKVVAQFDALYLNESIGWHEFPREDFTNIWGDLDAHPEQSPCNHREG